MQLTVTFIVLSIVGLINACYLAYRHYQKKPLVCPINHDCNVVVESQWSTLLGVRNEILGILFFAAMLSAMMVRLYVSSLAKELTLFIVIAAALGLLFSLILTLIQKFIIREYCFYCLISAGITFLLFLNALAL